MGEPQTHRPPDYAMPGFECGICGTCDHDCVKLGPGLENWQCKHPKHSNSSGIDVDEIDQKTDQRRDERLSQSASEQPKKKKRSRSKPKQPEKRAEYPQTDYGNAQRLNRDHGSEVRYCFATGQWLIFNGYRWCPDENGEIMRRAKQTAASIYSEAANAEDDNERKALGDWAKSSQSVTRLRAMIELAKSEPGIPVSVDQLDADPWLINTLSGTLNLHTGELRKHDPADLITKLAPVEYDPQATCPAYEAFLDRIFQGNTWLIEYVERLLAFSLTGDIRHHILPIAYGEGANGKSTLFDVAQHIAGDYSCPAPESLLTTRSGDEHPTELARLAGKRLVVASETDESKKLRIGLVKKLTGDEHLSGRYMRQDYFTFQRTHKTFLMTNNKPRISEDSSAIWRRVKLIPFTVSIPRDEQDPDLPHKLKAEAPGILARLVQAAQRWIDDNYDLCEPGEVSQATEEYRADENPLADFIEQRCTMVPGANVTRPELWEAYSRWASDQGERHPLGRRSLFDRIRKLEGVEEGYARSGGKMQRVFKGIGLAFQGTMAG
jgi:putative DNA primase/helicase